MYDGRGSRGPVCAVGGGDEVAEDVARESLFFVVFRSGVCGCVRESEDGVSGLS